MFQGGGERLPPEAEAQLSLASPAPQPLAPRLNVTVALFLWSVEQRRRQSCCVFASPCSTALILHKYGLKHLQGLTRPPKAGGDLS